MAYQHVTEAQILNDLLFDKDKNFSLAYLLVSKYAAGGAGVAGPDSFGKFLEKTLEKINEIDSKQERQS